MLSLSVAVSVDCPSTTFKMAGSFSRHIFLAQAGRIFFPAISSFFNPNLFSRHIMNIFRQPVSCFPPYLSASRAFSGRYDICTPMKYEVWQWLAMDNRLVSIDMDMDHHCSRRCRYRCRCQCRCKLENYAERMVMVVFLGTMLGWSKKYERCLDAPQRHHSTTNNYLCSPPARYHNNIGRSRIKYQFQLLLRPL